jgi:hypothetical protein
MDLTKNTEAFCLMSEEKQAAFITHNGPFEVLGAGGHWGEHPGGEFDWLRVYRAAAPTLVAAMADRIEALEQHVADLLVDLPCGCGYDNPTDVCMKHLPLVRKLTEQLEQLVAINEAARADAKEAEAYADELAGDQVDLCCQLIAAEDKLAECEARLGKAVEALTFYADFHENPNDGPWGVSSQDFGKHARTTLTEIESSTSEGEKG